MGGDDGGGDDDGDDYGDGKLTENVTGLLTAGFCNLCIATSLAEFLSAYPT